MCNQQQGANVSRKLSKASSALIAFCHGLPLGFCFSSVLFVPRWLGLFWCLPPWNSHSYHLSLIRFSLFKRWFFCCVLYLFWALPCLGWIKLLESLWLSLSPSCIWVSICLPDRHTFGLSSVVTHNDKASCMIWVKKFLYTTCSVLLFDQQKHC